MTALIYLRVTYRIRRMVLYAMVLYAICIHPDL